MGYIEQRISILLASALASMSQNSALIFSTGLLQAYVWVKPPGESDGSSQATTPGNVPDAEGKRFDPSCDSNDPSKVTDEWALIPEDRRVCRTHKRRTCYQEREMC